MNSWLLECRYVCLMSKKRSVLLCKYKLAVKLVILESKHPVCVLCMTQCDLKDRVKTMGREEKIEKKNIIVIFRYLLNVSAY